jgi:hypothetical protein
MNDIGTWSLTALRGRHRQPAGTSSFTGGAALDKYSFDLYLNRRQSQIDDA